MLKIQIKFIRKFEFFACFWISKSNLHLNDKIENQRET